MSIWADPFDLLTKGVRVGGLDSDAAKNIVWKPKVDIKTSEKDITLSFEVPGVSSDQLNIEVHEGILTVSGERTVEKKKEGEKVYSERFSGKFRRSFSIPHSVQPGDIKATLEHGVLTIVVPIPEKAKAKKISIQSKL